MLEDGEIVFLNGPLGSVSELRDPGLNYFGEVQKTLISAATKETVFNAYFFQLGNTALFNNTYHAPYIRNCSIFLVLFVSRFSASFTPSPS